MAAIVAGSDLFFDHAELILVYLKPVLEPDWLRDNQQYSITL